MNVVAHNSEREQLHAEELLIRLEDLDKLPSVAFIQRKLSLHGPFHVVVTSIDRLLLRQQPPRPHAVTARPGLRSVCPLFFVKSLSPTGLQSDL
jgi:hypothetical protein